MKKPIEYSIILILLVPLLFINIRDSHDWGDDFAQYLQQAQNLIDGVSQNQSDVIFNDAHFIGPKAYPVGFPLILAPVLKLFGYNIEVLNSYMSLFLILGCFIGYLFLRRKFSLLTGIITTLIIAYNPVMLSLKAEILSDLPFLFISLLSLYLITSETSVFKHLLIGICIALAIHIRSVGYLLLITYIISLFFQFRSIRQNNMKPILIGTLSFALLFMILKFGFPCDTNYPFPLETENFWNNLNSHLTYNLDNLFVFFKKFNASPFNYSGLLAGCALITFSVIGLFQAWRINKFDLINIYTLLYILTILTLKFGDAGFRFIIPILFFIFSYAVSGLKLVAEGLQLQRRWMPLVFGSLVFISYQDELNLIIKTAKETNEGPEKPDIQKLFTYLQTNLKETDVIEFEKPRVIAYYTKCKSVAILPVQPEEGIKKDIEKFKINYILVHYILTDHPIRNYVTNPANQCTSVYKLNDVELFKVN